MIQTDVLVIGGGPAGLAAATAAAARDVSVVLIERERRLGGILKQCIHDGFGLIRFGEKLSGPEYAERWVEKFRQAGIKALTSSFVTEIESEQDGFTVHFVNRQGVDFIKTKALILATGCRERTAKQVNIHGTRPAGIYTAGTAQNFINLEGEMVGKKCVILGSGDIGLIMARRLTLEGAEVVGVYEVKPTPSGLRRNIHQCLDDYDIPLYLSHTVTRVFGHDRLEGVEIAKVDEKMRPIEDTKKRIDCDTLILSVGLIPENELAERLHVDIDPHTKGPVCDERLMCSVPGIFSCGNALHVNDLVDYVSESGETAGNAAAAYVKEMPERRLICLDAGRGVGYIVPQRLDLTDGLKDVTVYFRSGSEMDNVRFRIRDGEKTIFERKIPFVRPPEMQRLKIDFSKTDLGGCERLTAEIEADES
ncbi:MAG: NAD(P)/FAD-dependent oxidoreductase [Eubacterium sp.]|jgi:NADPH-dependent 2,4-dienoyl-CoA reductase/sulfur reductase-like enzyme